MKRSVFLVIGIVVPTVFASVSHAESSDPARQCLTQKLKDAGRYSFCLLRAETEAVKSGEDPDFSRCTDRFRDSWLRLDARFGAACPLSTVAAPGEELELASAVASLAPALTAAAAEPSNLDVFQNAMADQVARLSAALRESVAAPLEYCELPATGQTQCWDEADDRIFCDGTGHDGETQAGFKLEPRGNIHGYIIDPRTGLMWEAKDNNNAGGIHDKDLTFSWAEAVDPDGPFLGVLNNHCNNDERVPCSDDSDCSVGYGTPVCGLAGYRDWRVPNVKELHSIVDYEELGVMPMGVFNNSAMCTAGSCTTRECSCSQHAYWSSTTDTRIKQNAFLVSILHGQAASHPKSFNPPIPYAPFFARAVRTLGGR
jgi:hypothetical protein